MLDDRVSHMNIESTPISDLIEDQANARKHDDKNIDAIAASLKRFGQQKPIVVRGDGVVIAGNGTLQAAKKLGWDKIDVVRTELEGSESVAFGSVDNRTAELAEWDYEVLEKHIVEMPDIAWEEFSVDELIKAPKIVEDEVPETPVDPITKPGDVWHCGEHVVVCADAAIATLDVPTVSMVWTDPPYGVSYVGKTKDAKTIKNDGEFFAVIVRAVLSKAYEACKPGACWYVAAPPGPQFYDFATILRDLGVLRQTLIWVKDSMVLGHSDYHYKHETIFYGWRAGKHHAPPTRDQTSVFEIPRPKASLEHPTMKPVELVARAIENSSEPGDVILDPFIGSGTTMIACEQRGRKCYGIEIEPKYVDVAVKRWEKLTGQKAIRQ